MTARTDKTAAVARRAAVLQQPRCPAARRPCSSGPGAQPLGEVISSDPSLSQVRSRLCAGERGQVACPSLLAGRPRVRARRERRVPGRLDDRRVTARRLPTRPAHRPHRATGARRRGRPTPYPGVAPGARDRPPGDLGVPPGGSSRCPLVPVQARPDHESRRCPDRLPARARRHGPEVRRGGPRRRGAASSLPGAARRATGLPNRVFLCDRLAARAQGVQAQARTSWSS